MVLEEKSFSKLVYRGACIEPDLASPNLIGSISIAGALKFNWYFPHLHTLQLIQPLHSEL